MKNMAAKGITPNADGKISLAMRACFKKKDGTYRIPDYVTVNENGDWIVQAEIDRHAKA